MEKRINVAELLKDCPQGMKLDCTMFEGIEFDSIIDSESLPIRCRIKNPHGGYTVYNFTKYGCLFGAAFAKCVIFPKGKTTWEGFVPNKFDINTLKPFDKVLVRGNVGQKWMIDFFCFFDNDKELPFVCVGHYVVQCIPYECNEHLLGTTEDCEDRYKLWLS